MFKTTVYLPDDLKDAIGGEALARGVSQATVIREALSAQVGTNRQRPKGGLYASGDPISGRVDELLADGFGHDR